MSCGTCPDSAQPTTRQNGTAPTPGRLLWSADVGDWYRRQRAKGGQPAIAMPASSEPAAAAAGPPRDERKQSVLELLGRDIPTDCWCLRDILDPANRGESHAIQWHIRQADEVYCYSDASKVEIVVRVGRKAYAFSYHRHGWAAGKLAVLGLGKSKHVEYTHVGAAHRAFTAAQKRVEAKDTGFFRWHCYVCGGYLRKMDGWCPACEKFRHTGSYQQ